MGSSFSGSKWEGSGSGSKSKNSNSESSKNKVHPNPEPKSKDKANDADEKYEFTLSDETMGGITRMDYDREMLIGMWSKNRVSHSSVFVCYFSKIKDTNNMDKNSPPELTARTFSIELFVDTELKKNVLSIKGPIANTRDYKCSEFYLIDANMEELIDIAKTTMNAHGKYDFFRNNCRHFSGSFLKKVKEKCMALSIDVPCDTLNTYIHRYGVGGVLPVKPAKPNQVGVDVMLKAMVPGHGYVVTTANSGLAGMTVQALSFIKVLKQFPQSSD